MVGATTTSDDAVTEDVEVAVAALRLARLYWGVRSRVTTGDESDLSETFVLVRLATDGPQRAAELSIAMGADPSTVSRQVAGLVRAGLVERRADPEDGRASILHPTEAGLARVREHRRRRGQAIEPILRDWSDHDRSTFVRLLNRYADGIETHRDQVVAVLVHGEPTPPDVSPPRETDHPITTLDKRNS